MSYVEHAGTLASPDIAHFNHGLAEIITAVMDPALRLLAIEEHDSVPGIHSAQPWGLGSGEYRLREAPERQPVTYRLQAIKPA